MLKSLHIKNYVFIDHLDIEFPDGLVVITGPTGAGKSVLIGALGLLCGAKADASSIASGADNCVVEGDFFFKDKALETLFAENDLEYDGGQITIRRVVSRTGRARAFVNDSPVNVSLLEALGGMLVDIHSQHDTLLLTSRSYQLGVLDAYAGNSRLLVQCSSAYAALRDAKAELSQLEAKLARAVAESDYNAAQYSRLAEAGLRDGELAELEAEQYQLSHSEQIKDLIASAADILDPADDERRGVNSDLASLSRILTHLSEYLPEFKDFAQRLESARIDIRDISDEVMSANERTSCSPERLQWVDDRIGMIYGLLSRYKLETEAQLIELRDSLKALAFGAEELEAQIEDLRKRCGQLQATIDTLCSQLHESREKAAAGFAAKVREGLAFMELDRATFRVELREAPQGPSGSDEVTYLFSSTGAAGQEVAVAKCASGGELSRIMLSLKQIMGDFMNMPTIVFDEIDTGVSGSVADKMGSVICEMGRRMQVFAITHLPQVAAKGSAHYLVCKTADTVHTVSTIKKLSCDERVLELARMLSGASLTPEAIANAKSLLAAQQA